MGRFTAARGWGCYLCRERASLPTVAFFRAWWVLATCPSHAGYVAHRPNTRFIFPFFLGRNPPTYVRAPLVSLSALQSEALCSLRSSRPPRLLVPAQDLATYLPFSHVQHSANKTSNLLWK